MLKMNANKTMLLLIKITDNTDNAPGAFLS